MDAKAIIQKVLAFVFIGLIIIGGYFFIKEQFKDRRQKGFITASGRVEGDEYNASSKISGKVKELYVEEGTQVKKGQLLSCLYSQQIYSQMDQARKEVTLWKNKLTQAQIALSQSKYQTDASINQAQANLNINETQLEKAVVGSNESNVIYQQSLANLKKASANLNFNEKEYERFKNLIKEDAVPKSKFDAVETQYLTAVEEYKLAQKEVEKAQNEIIVSKATIREGEAQIQGGEANLNMAKGGIYEIQLREEDVKNASAMLEKAMAAYDSARADFEDTKVFAPTDGMITAKIVECGEVISGGTPIVTIIDMDKLYLRIFLPTDKAGKIRIGNPSKIIPDALTGEVIEGEVYKISSKAEFTPKNVETKEQRAKLVFEVKIKILNNKERTLKPGMPCEAFIKFDNNAAWENVKIK